MPSHSWLLTRALRHKLLGAVTETLFAVPSVDHLAGCYCRILSIPTLCEHISSRYSHINGLVYSVVRNYSRIKPLVKSTSCLTKNARETSRLPHMPTHRSDPAGTAPPTRPRRHDPAVTRPRRHDSAVTRPNGAQRRFAITASVIRAVPSAATPCSAMSSVRCPASSVRSTAFSTTAASSTRPSE